MNGKPPGVSVIIRTKNEGAYLGQVLEALRNQDYANGMEIVVVDSGSTDDTTDIARRFGVRLIEMKPEAFTFGRALNIGSEAARGELLVNLSGHAIPVERDYLRHLTTPLQEPQVWATFGRDVPLPDCCPSQARDIEEWFPDKWVDRSRFFSNANACLRRLAWKEVPFDEELTGAEDAKWAQEVLATGAKIVYVPTAKVYHSHTCSPRFVYIRAVRETKALKTIDPTRAQVGLLRAIRFWFGISTLDYVYAWRQRSHPKWYLHIPVYRAFQSWGLYSASR
jgi:glycosyltransferase involved in cell wall biosynthesis